MIYSLIAALIASNGLLLFLFIRSTVKLRGLQKVSQHKSFWFGKMRDLVFEVGKFSDAQGVSDGDYNSREVEAQWNVFHAIVQKFYDTPNQKEGSNEG